MATDEIEAFRLKCDRQFKSFIQLFAAAMLVLVVNFLLPVELEAVGGYVFFFECLIWCTATVIIKRFVANEKTTN